MSEPIKVGDLVVVVCLTDCGCRARIGSIGTVASFQDGEADCVDCHKTLGPYLSAKWTNGWWFGVHRLKRIPPLDEMERDQIVEELTA
jgi:hypothetical protein